MSPFESIKSPPKQLILLLSSLGLFPVGLVSETCSWAHGQEQKGWEEEGVVHVNGRSPSLICLQSAVLCFKYFSMTVGQR